MTDPVRFNPLIHTIGLNRDLAASLVLARPKTSNTRTEIRSFKCTALIAPTVLIIWLTRNPFSSHARIGGVRGTYWPMSGLRLFPSASLRTGSAFRVTRGGAVEESQMSHVPPEWATTGLSCTAGHVNCGAKVNLRRTSRQDPTDKVRRKFHGAVSGGYKYHSGITLGSRQGHGHCRGR